jgi:hypothetical protein
MFNSIEYYVFQNFPYSTWDCYSSIITKVSSITSPHYEVTAAITKLNNKKSGDEFGISAEHFKLAGQSIVAALVEKFNAIFIGPSDYRTVGLSDCRIIVRTPVHETVIPL